MKFFIQLGLILLLFATIETQAQPLQIPIHEQNLESETLTGFQTFTNVVIFIRFKDEANYQAPFSLSEYEDMFNKEDDISLKHYFLEASYGKLSIESFLTSNASNQIIFYTDTFNRNYYEPKSTSNLVGYDIEDFSEIALREHGLLKRAIQFVDDLNLMDSNIDLDVNKDGNIDSLTFMISGEDTGWSSLLWPHQWSLYTHYDDIDAPKINGLKAYTYTFNLLGNSKDYVYGANVGILAHETFHLLGAPDLYHYYGYDYIENAGPWALMDSNSPIPVHMLGYLKYAYGGWIDSVTTITEAGRYTLGPIKDSPNYLLRFDTGYSNEFVYFEFRVKEGFYENTLPSEGLLVYRVDKDFYGNQDGYSETSNGPSINEVFIFRPYIKNTIEPITFPDDVSDEAYAGNIYLAALSQFNAFDDANTTSDFLMFHSDGTIMDIQITQVVIENGLISFSVSFERNISVSLEVGGYTLTENDFLVDHELLEYEGTLIGADDYDIYLSFDGSEATFLDTLYSDSFTFNSSNKTIVLAFYKDGVKYGDQVLTIPFVSSIESAHFPYGNDVYLAFYIPNINNLKQLTLTFDNFFELEDDFDYLYITTSSSEYAYTGTSLKNQTLDLTQYGGDIWIEFITDEFIDLYYGFYASIEVTLNPLYSFEDIISLKGEETVQIAFGSMYEELGVLISSNYEDVFTVEVTHTINTQISNTYQVTYDVFEDEKLLHTFYRTVIVLDAVNVSFDLIETQTIELGSLAFDFESLVNNVVSNSENFNVTITQDIDYMKTGSYEVILNIKDAFNFETSQSFTVDIVDTTKPIVVLNPGIDTIVAFNSFIDSGVSVTDFNTFNVEVIGTVSHETMGRYEITYRITDDANNVSEIKRIVHVIKNPNVNLIIKPSITTFTFGQRVFIPECIVEGLEDVFCDYDIHLNDIQNVGTHIITYSYTVSNVTMKKIWYVFVIPAESNQIIAMLPKREDVRV